MLNRVCKVFSVLALPCVNMAILSYNFQSSISYVFLAIREILLWDLSYSSPSVTHTFWFLCWLAPCCGAAGRLADAHHAVDPPTPLTPVLGECPAAWWSLPSSLAAFPHHQNQRQCNWCGVSPSLWLPAHAVDPRLSISFPMLQNCAPLPTPRKLWWSPYPQYLRVRPYLKWGLYRGQVRKGSLRWVLNQYDRCPHAMGKCRHRHA